MSDCLRPRWLCSPLVIFPTFFSLSLNLVISSSWFEPQSAPGLVFVDCIELLIFGCKEYNQSDFSLDHLVMFIRWKRSIFIPIPKKGKAKECSNYHSIAHISHSSKVMLNILQARLWIREPWTTRCSSWFQKRQRNQRSNCQHFLDHRESKGKDVPEKHLLLLHWLSPSLWLCGSQQTVEKF